MKFILLTLGVLLSTLYCVTPLQAEIVSAVTTQAGLVDSGAAAQVQAQLVAQGMTAESAVTLVQEMSAEEILYFAQEEERNQAGGNVGVVVGVLVVIALVVLIVYLVRRT